MDTKFCALESAPISEQQRQLFLDDFYSSFHQLKAKNAGIISTSIAEKNVNPHPESKKPESKKANRYAALTNSDVAEVRKKALATKKQYDFSTNDIAVWDIIVALNQLAQDICSSDLPTDNEEDAVLVKLTQDSADNILNNQNISWLRKILEIAILTKQSGFGNCQEKAFFGFAALVLESQKVNSLIHTLRLATFKNHFIVIVNEQILMDPWLNLAFPLDAENLEQNIDYVFAGFGQLIDYFTFQANGNCVTHEVIEGKLSNLDTKSMTDMPNCYNLLVQNQKYFAPRALSGKENQPKRRRMDPEIQYPPDEPTSDQKKIHKSPTDYLSSNSFFTKTNPDVESPLKESQTRSETPVNQPLRTLFPKENSSSRGSLLDYPSQPSGSHYFL
ncbi:Ceg14 family Dot/Icm T4SS effector [Legionella quateirensis]|uniref:Dot/Icm secretion system substrate n=1 Tax=Legionella quateirensis TaxID=45072 RepID=A0A378KNE2_9GAMM|nr:Ceg14 family Dot/Icm T4SS effector [Legionella quateirensis]KTD52846.1 substrate of the Dot/Icm secretion system [Legionella quateirensis]STY16424.1 Dot/Icm secretion system substrate [Legionella quateirensis]